jgi:hypothetical protein
MWNRLSIPREVRRGRKEQKLGRMVWLFSIFTLAYLTQVQSVDAGFYCDRIEQLPAVSDNRILGLLEPYAMALAGPKPFQIKHLTSRFFLVMPEDANCRVVGCYYRLLDVKGGEVNERFSFHGTGVIWYYSTPAEVRIEDFQDHYSNYGFETSTRTHIGVLLPRTAQAVLVEAVPPDALFPRLCRTESR